ncbi:protein phosphatase Slingshot homolog 2-like [Protopterus annectens]|uniref:protein phosphatase Slingshot homolog 2-like n=1 Tax=Protopterus annectens TaxID=7888 RepID=UPI001CFB23AA|nr:protein phosphatase Slingshot homolog 2-like [Protopterus annectens]
MSDASPPSSLLLTYPKDLCIHTETPSVKELEEILNEGRVPFNPVNEVWPNLFLGDVTTSHNRFGLWKMGITHVLNAAHGKFMCRGSPDFYGVCMEYYGVPANDLPHFDLSIYFCPAADFIHKALSTPGGKILVHCAVGVSRSASLVLAYLMLHQNLCLVEAIKKVKQERCIFPNQGFLKQLRALDMQLRQKKDNRTHCATCYCFNFEMSEFPKVETDEENRAGERGEIRKMIGQLSQLVELLTPACHSIVTLFSSVPGNQGLLQTQLGQDLLNALKAIQCSSSQFKQAMPSDSIGLPNICLTQQQVSDSQENAPSASSHIRNGKPALSLNKSDNAVLSFAFLRYWCMEPTTSLSVKELENILDNIAVEPHHVDEVWPSLYLGDLVIARNKEELNKLGITHVLNAAHSEWDSNIAESFYGKKINYYGIAAEDYPNYDISVHFYPAANYIHNALQSSKGKVLVHCILGRSRSPSLVIAYLMIYHHLSLEAAVKKLTEHRAISPNRGFLKQLHDLDIDLRQRKKNCALL